VPVRIARIAVAQHFRRGGHDGDAAARGAQCGKHAFAALAVDVDGNGGIEGRIHRAIVAPPAAARESARERRAAGPAGRLLQTIHRPDGRFSTRPCRPVMIGDNVYSRRFP